LPAIDRFAFSNSALTAITIPAKVVHLEEFAFLDCDSLQSIHFAPNSQFRTLTHPILPSPQRASICLPASLEQIDGSRLIDFQSVSMELGNPNLLIDKKILMDPHGIIRYLGHNSILRVSAAVEVMGPGSFSYCAAKLAKGYGLDALCLRAVQKWAARFRAGEHDVEDDDRSGPPPQTDLCDAILRFLEKPVLFIARCQQGALYPENNNSPSIHWPRAEILQGPMDSAQAFRGAKGQ
jgi:hypothetical protein